MDHEADVDPPCGRYWGAWPSSPLQGSHTHPSAEECIRSWLHHLLGIALSWWELPCAMLCFPVAHTRDTKTCLLASVWGLPRSKAFVGSAEASAAAFVGQLLPPPNPAFPSSLPVHLPETLPNKPPMCKDPSQSFPGKLL